MLRTFLFVTLGCAAASPRADGAPTTPGSAAVDAAMTCSGAGGAKWTAKFARTAIDECVYREKDSILDLRVGTLEEGIVLHLIDFKGTGRYSIAGGSGSKVSLVAPGGVGEATTTSVDSTSDEPCKASCLVDVSEANVTRGDGTVSLELTCTALTRVAAGACTKCTGVSSALIRANAVACRKA